MKVDQPKYEEIEAGFKGVPENDQEMEPDFEADDGIVVLNETDSDEDEGNYDSGGSLSPRNYILRHGPEFLRIHFGAEMAADLQNISEEDFYNAFNQLIEMDDVANRRNQENLPEELPENDNNEPKVKEVEPTVVSAPLASSSADNQMHESETVSASASCSKQED